MNRDADRSRSYLLCRYKAISIILLWVCSSSTCTGDSSYLNISTCLKTSNHITSQYTCDLQQQSFILLQQNWNSTSFVSLWNGSSVDIEPQCNANGKTLAIFNTSSIVIDHNELDLHKECLLYLRLDNCNATSLSDLFSLIHLRKCEVDNINLTVEQFDITDNSVVGSLDITSTNDYSTIINSTVNNINYLKIEGDHRMDISDSSLGYMKKLIYNSTFGINQNDRSSIRGTKIVTIAKTGFEVVQGLLKIENVTIESLFPESIVIHGGVVHLENISINNSHPNSIVMIGEGSIKFTNLNIVGKPQKFTFEITSEENQKVWPLGLLFPQQETLTTIASLLSGFSVGLLVTLMCYFCYRQRSTCWKSKQINNTRHSQNTIDSNTKPLTSHCQPHLMAKPPQNDIEETVDTYDDCNINDQRPVSSFLPSPLPTHSGNPNTNNAPLENSSVECSQDPMEDEPDYEDCVHYQNIQIQPVTEVVPYHSSPDVNDDEPVYDEWEDYHNRNTVGFTNKQLIAKGTYSCAEADNDDEPIYENSESHQNMMSKSMPIAKTLILVKHPTNNENQVDEDLYDDCNTSTQKLVRCPSPRLIEGAIQRELFPPHLDQGVSLQPSLPVLTLGVQCPVGDSDDEPIYEEWHDNPNTSPQNKQILPGNTNTAHNIANYNDDEPIYDECENYQNLKGTSSINKPNIAGTGAVAAPSDDDHDDDDESLCDDCGKDQCLPNKSETAKKSKPLPPVRTKPLPLVKTKPPTAVKEDNTNNKTFHGNSKSLESPVGVKLMGELKNNMKTLPIVQNQVKDSAMSINPETITAKKPRQLMTPLLEGNRKPFQPSNVSQVPPTQAGSSSTISTGNCPGKLPIHELQKKFEHLKHCS